MLLGFYAFLSWAYIAFYTLIYLEKFRFILQNIQIMFLFLQEAFPDSDRLLNTLLCSTATTPHLCFYLALLLLYCHFFSFLNICPFSITDCEQLAAGADLCLSALFLSGHTKIARNNKHSEFTI